MSTVWTDATREVAKLVHVTESQVLTLGALTWVLRGDTVPSLSFPQRPRRATLLGDFPVQAQCPGTVACPVLPTSGEERYPMGPGKSTTAFLVSSLTFSRFLYWGRYEDIVPSQVWYFKWVIFWDLFIFYLRGQISHRWGGHEAWLMVHICFWCVCPW